MDNNGRLYSQVAAAAGVAPEKAMVACYLVNLAKAGKTMDEAATLLRKDRSDVRGYARGWGISFVDYSGAVPPLRLAWTKVKRGRWELHVGDALIATALADGAGGYVAQQGSSNPFYGSNAEVAMRRLSVDLERRSVDLFGVDDVAISMPEVGVLAPKLASDPRKLATALAA